MNYLTSEAKAKLSSTIRELRDRLLTDIHDAADSIYRLSLPIDKAGLAEEQRVKRSRLEQWLKEQDRDLEIARLETEKLAAATFLNRLVVIKQLEALELIKPKVVTGGWQSSGYKEFREFAPDLCKDDSEGFSTLLGLLYDEWALDLPGLFGKVGITELLPVPSVTLRATIEALNDLELDSAWLDDTTLGWVYQFWNDPDRKALDDKINNRGKIEHHEIAAKTQIFTERYMVEWLLQNSLNQQWLAICAKNNWTPAVKANGVLDALEENRNLTPSPSPTKRGEKDKERDWKGIADEIINSLTPEQHQWKYWVSQPLLPETIEAAPQSIKNLKLIDPAVGSGHFLVIAFSLLFSFYKEEAQHRGETWTDTEIAELIIEHNLHGVDLDDRAVQIAAAALFLKAKSCCRDAHPRWMNLVASNLGLSSLPIESPEVNELQLAIYQATGIPADLIAKIIQALHGADHLGSLLKIDEAIENAIAQYERQIVTTEPVQGDIFTGYPPTQMRLSFDETKKSILTQLGKFLAKCTSGDDLGLRLRGEQLAAGVRFIEIVKENKYHLCVANPPYNSAGKLSDPTDFQKLYPEGDSDLFAAFMQRGLQLVKTGGLSASVTLSNWMYLGTYEKLRNHLLDNYSITVIADLGKAAFSAGSMLINTSMNIFQRFNDNHNKSIAIRAFKPEEIIVTPEQVSRNEIGLIAGYEKFEFETQRLREVIEGQPLIYWWDDDFLKRYAEIPKLEEESDVKIGMQTGNNLRSIRQPWEVCINNTYISKIDSSYQVEDKLASNNRAKYQWIPYIKGAADKKWFEPLSSVINWQFLGCCYFFNSSARFGRGTEFYFKPGIAYKTIGSNFSARLRRYQSIFDTSGASVFPNNIKNTACLMNSELAREVLSALNPTVNFQANDANRLPLFPIESADKIFDRLDRAFSEHEAARETSVEFRQPAPSPWNYAQEWAQQAVDRPAGKPLPEYEPVYDEPLPTDYVSYAIGVALSRFEPSSPNPFSPREKGDNSSSNSPLLSGEGLGVRSKEGEVTLPNGILYLSAYSEQDSLEHPASQVIKQAWNKHGEQIAANKPLQKWLRESFFKDVHLKMYEKRPIYFPLSSEKKNFVAFINIHRWTDNTLQTLLAEHLNPEKIRLEGELKDLTEARKSVAGVRCGQALSPVVLKDTPSDKLIEQEAQATENRGNQNRYATVQKLGEELQDFINLVAECAERGAPKHKPQDTARETDARFQMNLDDGMMINSAALWTLLEPQWKDPKKWWSELCNAKGKKDYDWSHLAARYFPKRVDRKCQQDPSLAVAHGCFWQYHPEKAYQWELRLQDEIAKDFTIDEVNSDELRQAFEREHLDKVEELKAKEQQRRQRNLAKANSGEED